MACSGIVFMGKLIYGLFLRGWYADILNNLGSRSFMSKQSQSCTNGWWSMGEVKTSKDFLQTYSKNTCNFTTNLHWTFRVGKSSWSEYAKCIYKTLRVLYVIWQLWFKVNSLRKFRNSSLKIRHLIGKIQNAEEDDIWKKERWLSRE